MKISHPLVRTAIAYCLKIQHLIFLDASGGQALGRLLRSEVVAGSLLGWVSRICQMGFQVLSVRLIIGTIGADSYAGIVLITGLLGWISNFDFGFSYGLMNTIAVARAKHQDDNSLKVLALASYLFFSFLGVLICFILAPLVADHFLAAVPSRDRAALLLTSTIILVLVGTANIGNRLLFANQRAPLFYLLSLCGTAISLAGLVALRLHLIPRNLEVVIGIIFLPQASIGLISILISMRGTHFVLPTMSELRSVFLISMKFLLLSFLTLLTVQTDTFIISQLLNARDIAIYGIYTKLFTAMNLLITTPLGVLWPRFSFHAARGERGEMKRLLRSYLLVSLGTMSLFGVFVQFCGHWIVDILAPNQHLLAPPYFIVLLTFLQLAILWTGGFHTTVISMSVLGPALLFTPLQAIISCLAEWFLARRFGVVGVTGGILLSYIVLAAWLSPLMLWIIIRKQRHQGLEGLPASTDGK